MKIAGYISTEYPDFRPRTLVHVGAHEAHEIFQYEKLRPGRVLWIDAVDDHLEVFRGLVDKLPEHRRGAHAYRVALITDRDDDRRDFHEFSNKGASSSIFRGTGQLFDRWPELYESGNVRVLATATIDTLIKREGIAPETVDMLVIDAQGAELLCLTGAVRTLETVRFLEVEVSKAPIYDNGVLFDELDAWLRARGFERRTEVPWHGDVVYEKRAAGNALQGRDP